MDYSYINRIKHDYLKRYEFLFDKLKNEDQVVLRTFYGNEEEMSEGFLKYDGKSFLFITHNEDGVDSTLKVDTAKAKELINEADFSDLFIFEDNEKAKLYYEKEVQRTDREYPTAMERFIGEFNNDPEKESNIAKRFDNSKFLEDYLAFVELEPYDLSHKNIMDTYYKFSFKKEENGETQERSFLVFPELNYTSKNNIIHKERILGSDKIKERALEYGSELESSLNYGCVITELIDGNPDFVNAQSISLDELNIIITGQRELEDSIVTYNDTIATKLLRKYLVANEGNSGEKQKEESLLRGVSFYIDDETGDYVVEINKKINGKENPDTRRYPTFDEFESDETLLNILNSFDYKKDSVNAELLNYEEGKRVLKEKLIANEKYFFDLVSDKDKFIDAFNNSDDWELCQFRQYFCDTYEFLSNENYLSELGLPLSSSKPSYFEKFLEGKNTDITNLKSGHCTDFISDVLEKDILLVNSNNQNERFQNINVIYGLYGLDNSEVIDKINNLGSNPDSNAVRRIFIEDFDSKYWINRINYLSTPKTDEFGETYSIDAIRGMSKEQAFEVFAELSFYKGVTYNPEKFKSENGKIDLDIMFKDNSLIYSDVGIKNLDINDINNLDNKSNYYISNTSYIDDLEMEKDNNTFKRKSQLLKITSKDLNEEFLRENFDEIRSSNDYNILLNYIQSSIRYPDDSKELKNICAKYKEDVDKYGKESAIAILENYLSITSVDKNDEVSSVFDRVFNDNKKNLNAFFEYYSLDFTTIMKKTLTDLDENGNNIIRFDIWEGLGDCSIIKESKNQYTITIDCGNGDVRTQTYDLNGALNILNYKNEESVDLIPQEDKDKLIDKYKDKVLSSFAGEILEANYADSFIKASDSENTKIQKILASGDAVILRKNMERTKDVEFIMLQKTDDNKIIKKTVKVLPSNKRAAELNFKGFGNAIYDETHIGNRIERDYYLTARTPDNPYSKNPEVTIGTEILSSQELTKFIDSLNLRAWDVEKSDYYIPNISSKDAVSIETDKKVFEFARTSSMTNEEKRIFVLNEKIKNHLANGNGEYESCSYSNINTREEDGCIITEKEIVSIERSVDKDGQPGKSFDVNVVRFLVVDGPNGEHDECPMVQRLEKAIYIDDKGDLNISLDCKRSVERVLDNIFENKMDTAECSNFFKDNKVDKQKLSENVSFYANIIDNYGKFYKAINQIRNKDFYKGIFKEATGYAPSSEDIKKLLDENENPEIAKLVVEMKKDDYFKNLYNNANPEEKDNLIIRGLNGIVSAYDYATEVLRQDSVEGILGAARELGKSEYDDFINNREANIVVHGIVQNIKVGNDTPVIGQEEVITREVVREFNE